MFLKFELCLYSQPVGRKLLVDHLASGAGHPADILAHARVMAFGYFFKFCRCFIEQTASLVFQCVACDTIHLILDETSSFALLDFREHPFFLAFLLWTFRWLVQLHHEIHHELLAHFLELLFRSLFVGSSNRFCCTLACQ